MNREGLILYVARTAGLGDCTNGGVTSTHDVLTLVGTLDDGEHMVRPLPTWARVIAASDDRPAVALEVTVVGEPTVHLVPVAHDGVRWMRIPGWFMAGGNYASSSDARVGDAVAEVLGHRFYGAISVHDRREV